MSREYYDERGAFSTGPPLVPCIVERSVRLSEQTFLSKIIRSSEHLGLPLFVLLHLSCFAVIWVGWSPAAVLIAAALFFVRMFAITGFFHRYFSHRTFRTHRLVQFLFAFIGGAAAQRGALWWASQHRRHHTWSDGPDDLHSPHHKGLLTSHVGWIWNPRCRDTDIEAVRDLVRYRELRVLDTLHFLPPAILAVLVYFVGEILRLCDPGLHTSGPQVLVWGFAISTVALYHATFSINSLSHLWGSQPFATVDHSRNNMFLALITLGEGWHNNHHKFPQATRQGFAWWQVDITYYLLRMMALFHIIWDIHPVPASAQHPRSTQKQASES